jgi:hypothetical protein
MTRLGGWAIDGGVVSVVAPASPTRASAVHINAATTTSEGHLVATQHRLRERIERLTDSLHPQREIKTISPGCVRHDGASLVAPS